jgi:Tol biopolymer transport system component
MWTVSVLGQSARELRENAGGFEVSPDGAHIAFWPEPGPSGYVREIWVMGTKGDNPQRVLALAENESLDNVHWSPDGKRLAYNKKPRTLGETFQTTIETCDLSGANRAVVVSYERREMDDFCWLPDQRIVYSREEPPGSLDGNLWQIGIDGQAGTPTGKPKPITQWVGSVIGRQLSASADGKRLVLQKATYKEQVYLAELAAGGTRLSPLHRLNTDETYDQPYSWTADGKAILLTSDRNGIFGIFKQGISQDTAEPLVTGAVDRPRLSSDGAWTLYMEAPESSETLGPSTPVRLMRIPVSGGVPQPVLETRGEVDYDCARAPASLCVVLEQSQDEKRLTLTAFDPLKGRGKLLRTFETHASVHDFASALSPDGSIFAISRNSDAEIHIRLLSLSGGSDREVRVRGWSGLYWMGLQWSADGRGFYCSSHSLQIGTLLYVDLNGSARILEQYKGMGGYIWGIPSPDGRYLAILNTVFNSNVWMLEGF